MAREVGRLCYAGSGKARRAEEAYAIDHDQGSVPSKRQPTAHKLNPNWQLVPRTLRLSSKKSSVCRHLQLNTAEGPLVQQCALS